MSNKLTKIASALTLITLLAIPMLAQGAPVVPGAGDQPAGFAASFFGCGGTGTTMTVTCVLKGAIQAMLAVVFMVAVIFLVIGGFRYIASQGNEEAVEKAKGTITNAIIGIVIAILAWIIVAAIVNLVGNNSG